MRTGKITFVGTLAIATVLLVGCSPLANSGDSESSGESGGSPASGVATCEDYAASTDPLTSLFTTNTLSVGLPADQVYGDGSELSVTLSPEAIAAGLLPQLDLNRINADGFPELVSGLIFDPTTGGDGTYSTSTFEFGNDELVGTAVVAQIFAISDQVVGDAEIFGDKLLLGNYCITYANDGS